MNWQVPNMWEGGECWIIGGGPSLPQQFDIPDHIVTEVVNRRLTPDAYSPYLSTIHKKHVIGINAAYLLGNWVDIMFFGDNGFYQSHRNALLQWDGIKIGCSIGQGQKELDGVKMLSRDGNKKYGISKDPSKVCWNGNSGAAAISVAANAGVKRIILVGFDMILIEGQQHWHGVYKRAQINRVKPKQDIKTPFERHLIGFPQIATDARARGIEIINASPNSKINSFPKATVKELL